MQDAKNNFKVGEIRPTQILFSYGVGSIIDLPNISVMVMGLEDWNVHYMNDVSEERLLAAVKNRLGNQVNWLKLPPVPEDNGNGFFNPFAENSTIGIPVAPFPRWLRCPKCNLLAPIASNLFELKTDFYHTDKIRYVHASCPKFNQPTVLPARFLVACEDGHLDDFPWIEYVHKGMKDCIKARLSLLEYGVSGTARDIEVVCDTCNKRRRMAEAFEREQIDILPKCRGRNPHLRMFSDNGCQEKRNMEPILLGASNSWFPITMSALHIPAAGNKLQQLIEDYWAILEKVTSKEVLIFSRSTGQLKSFAEYSDNEIWDALVVRKNSEQNQNNEVVDLKIPEWNVFTNPEESGRTDDFQLTTVEVPSGYENYFSKVVLVERIKEVRALIGFTRIESPGDFDNISEIPEIKQVGLSKKSPAWVPASLVKGEGIFLQFNEETLSNWLKKKEILESEKSFWEAHCGWRRKRKIVPEKEGFYGIRFILLHSFSHALMRQFSLECGYSSASIRERIYSQNPSEDKNPMAGVLIYTSAPDSEGTLGGLVHLGNPQILARHIYHGLERMRLCSSDPLCAEHSPLMDDTSLHAAACHACLFVPETSCERGNKYLDRSLISNTVCKNTDSFFD